MENGEGGDKTNPDIHNSPQTIWIRWALYVRAASSVEINRRVYISFIDSVVSCLSTDDDQQIQGLMIKVIEN